MQIITACQRLQQRHCARSSAGPLPPHRRAAARGGLAPCFWLCAFHLPGILNSSSNCWRPATQHNTRCNTRQHTYAIMYGARSSSTDLEKQPNSYKRSALARLLTPAPHTRISSAQLRAAQSYATTWDSRCEWLAGCCALAFAGSGHHCHGPLRASLLRARPFTRAVGQACEPGARMNPNSPSNLYVC